tara:strand:+ start:609 stop:1640 length:1032 start_codon:yes stop_codon:yes gene_type:complete
MKSNSILLIGNYLSKHGYNPTSIEHLKIELSKKYNIKFASDKKNFILRFLDSIFIILKNINKCKLIIFDVFSTKAFILSVFIVLIAKYYKVPYVPVFRGGNLNNKYKQHPKLFKYLFDNAKTIICPSQYLAHHFCKLKSPIKVIPNYIVLNDIEFKFRSKLRPNLLWVRSIHKIYNPEMAINVLNNLKKKYTDAKLCMVGPIKDKSIKSLRNLIDKFQLGNSVLFKGKLSKIDWYEISKSYDIFINTTNYDNQPISVIESMALGLPIISTNAGGIEKLIVDNKTGFVIEKNDIIGMTNKVLRLLDGSIKFKEISLNARKEVESFDVNNVILLWDKLIYNIINE